MDNVTKVHRFLRKNKTCAYTARAISQELSMNVISARRAIRKIVKKGNVRVQLRKANYDTGLTRAKIPFYTADDNPDQFISEPDR